METFSFNCSLDRIRRSLIVGALPAPGQERFILAFIHEDLGDAQILCKWGQRSTYDGSIRGIKK